jgi:hypothetical protein
MFFSSFELGSTAQIEKAIVETKRKNKKFFERKNVLLIVI